MKKFVLRFLLYGLLALAAAVAIVSRRWFEWHGYRTKAAQSGITVYSDLDPVSVRGLLGLCQAFREYFNSAVLPVPPGKLDVYLFKHQKDYYGYCKRVRATTNSPFGFYSRRHRLIVINGEMGTGTVLHELVHHFMHTGQYDLPPWLEEGVASYFERGLGYYEGPAKLRLLFGYLNPVRFQEVQASALANELSFASMMRSQQTASTFFVYADRCRALHAFLEAYLATKDMDKSCRLALGIDAATAERHWVEWVRTQVLGFDFEFWQRTQIYATEAEFDQLLGFYGARWDDSLEIYTANQ